MTTKPHILMIGENYYPADIRVRKEATTLKEVYDITVISLRRDGEKWHEVVDSVEVFRLPELTLLCSGSPSALIKGIVAKMSFVLQYAFFTIMSAFVFLSTHITRRYKVIHAHNPPDTLFLIGLVGKLLGVRFIYDHHDLSPEIYSVRFGKGHDIIYKTLLLFERFSCRLADVVITTNNSYKQIEITRNGIDPGKVFVVRNNPIIKECRSELHERAHIGHSGCDKKQILFLGCVSPQDGVDELIRSLHYIVDQLEERNFVCNIVGDGDSLESIKELCKSFKIEDNMNFTGYVFDREIVKDYLTKADVCVEPAPDNELNRYSTFIKIMEYMAASKPIVAFNLKETRYSAEGSAIFVPSGDIEGFAYAIKKLLDDPQLREELGIASLARIKTELNWGNASLNLIQAYKSLSL